MNYVNADGLIKPDTRTPAQKWLDAEMDKRGASEQGAEQYPTLEAIALEIIEENQRLRAVEAAARNLAKVKGRFHTEQAFKALAALLVNAPVTPACPVCNQTPVFERDRRVAEWAGHCKHCAVEGPSAATEAEARRLWIVWHHKRSDAQSLLVNTEGKRPAQGTDAGPV